MNRVMIDLETLGTSPGCVILSIGAVVINSAEEFHVHIDPVDSIRNGLHMDVDTVMWWMNQSEAARHAAFDPKRNMSSLEQACDSFCQWINWKKVDQVWCNGAAFDFPLLKTAFAKVDYKLPWPYYAEMDFRTIKNMISKETFKKLQVKPTLAHNALSDAEAQAETLKAILKHGLKT